jgi:hypothetical protein
VSPEQGIAILAGVAILALLTTVAVVLVLLRVFRTR